MITELDGREVIAFAELYKFLDRTDAVVVTAWDDPTPFAVRLVTIVNNSNLPPLRGGGYYFTDRTKAFTHFKSYLPG